jgi:hypothetical protein
MDLFDWKDLLVIVAALFGAVLSSRKLPGINSASIWVNFTKEIITTVCIANFCTIIYANDINRTVHFLGECFPFYAYALFISLGVVVVLNLSFQAILLKIQDKKEILYFFTPFVSIVELAVLCHLLYIS